MEKKTVSQLKLLQAIDQGKFNFDGLRKYIADMEDPDGLPGVRTVRRYLSEIERAGFPWVYDRNADRYKFADGFSLKGAKLDEELLGAFMAVTRHAEALGPQFQASLSRLGTVIGVGDSKTSTSIPDIALRTGYFDFDPSVNEAIGSLGQAQQTHRQVTFSYEDKHGTYSSRKVDPYGITMTDGRAYLIGFDHSRNDRRTFAIDNIKGIATLPSTFVRPPNFDLAKHGASSISGLSEADELATATVRFSPVVAKAALAASAQHRRDIDAQANGGVDITFHVADQKELIRWSMRYGSEAEVIAPDSARAAAAEIALSLATKYIGTPQGAPEPAESIPHVGTLTTHAAPRQGLPGLHYIDLEEMRDERGFDRVVSARRAAPGAQFTGQIIEVGSTTVGDSLEAIVALDSGRRTITPLVVEAQQARDLAVHIGAEPVVARYDRNVNGWDVVTLTVDQHVEIAR